MPELQSSARSAGLPHALPILHLLRGEADTVDPEAGQATGRDTRPLPGCAQGLGSHGPRRIDTEGAGEGAARPGARVIGRTREAWGLTC